MKASILWLVARVQNRPQNWALARLRNFQASKNLRFLYKDFAKNSLDSSLRPWKKNGENVTHSLAHCTIPTIFKYWQNLAVLWQNWEADIEWPLKHAFIREKMGFDKDYCTSDKNLIEELVCSICRDIFKGKVWKITLNYQFTLKSM